MNNQLLNIEDDEEYITYINDIRNERDFRNTTFSNFKIVDVKKQLLTTIISGKVQDACYWTGELICSGRYDDIWEIILQYLGKNIYTGNPKLPIYLEMRFQSYCSIIKNNIYTTKIQLRNLSKIRKLFTEIICVLCFSNKKPAIDYLKINSEEEFNIINISEKIRAPSLDFVIDIFYNKDPDECIIATNEFAYSCYIKDTMSACYWLEWIIEFDIYCKKKQIRCNAVRRYDIPVEPKFQADIIWIFWDVLQKNAKQKEEPHRNIIERIIKSLLHLFCINYTHGCSKKRRYLLYFAIQILTEQPDFKIEMISNKIMIDRILQNIDNIYKNIKNNETGTNMDYLYQGLEVGNEICVRP